jgi:glycosyltransferase involved in cell wall biosynthesis
LPIALLEALSYGLPVLASDIPANLEVGLPAEHYFPLGNVDALADRIKRQSSNTLTLAARESIRSWVVQRYDWQDIAEKTVRLYASCISGNGS